MTLPYSVMWYLATEDIDWQNADDLPFEANIEDEEEVNKKFDEYLSAHNVQIIENKLFNCDIDRGCATFRIIFTFDGDYYGFTYHDTTYEGYCDFPEEVDHYIPKKITKTIYEIDYE